MEWLIPIAFIIHALDFVFLAGSRRKQQKERIYEQTVRDVNWNRK
jgi:hypothetical protein